VKLANEVAAVLVRSETKNRRIGTVLTLTDASMDRIPQWENSFETLPIGDNDPQITNVATRLLEIFLDRVAWRAAEDEWSWILDGRYGQLLDDSERDFAKVLEQLKVPESPKWKALRELLSDYGLKEKGGLQE
jgi:hypothetical protein